MSATPLPPIQVDIVSGFLGAGKTTLIRRLIGEEACTDRLMLLENEFGVVNIDGEVLENTGVQVESILASCICCSGADTLIGKLTDIARTAAPRQLIVEPTGVAHLSDVRRIFHYPVIRDLYRIRRIVTVVDAANYLLWLRVSKTFFYDQIQFSDLLYVSKTDECPPEQVAGLLELLDAVHPDCPVFTELSYFLAAWNGETEKKTQQTVYYPQPGRHGGNFETLAVESSSAFNREGLLQLLDKVQEGAFGSVYRMKGSFQDETGTGFTLDWVGNRYQLIHTETNERPVTRLCVIGRDLDRNSLNREFARLAE